MFGSPTIAQLEDPNFTARPRRDEAHRRLSALRSGRRSHCRVGPSSRCRRPRVACAFLRCGWRHRPRARCAGVARLLAGPRLALVPAAALAAARTPTPHRHASPRRIGRRAQPGGRPTSRRVTCRDPLTPAATWTAARSRPGRSPTSPSPSGSGVWVSRGRARRGAVRRHVGRRHGAHPRPGRRRRRPSRSRATRSSCPAAGPARCCVSTPPPARSWRACRCRPARVAEGVVGAAGGTVYVLDEIALEPTIAVVTVHRVIETPGRPRRRDGRPSSVRRALGAHEAGTVERHDLAIRRVDEHRRRARRPGSSTSGSAPCG